MQHAQRKLRGFAPLGREIRDVAADDSTSDVRVEKAVDRHVRGASDRFRDLRVHALDAIGVAKHGRKQNDRIAGKPANGVEERGQRQLVEPRDRDRALPFGEQRLHAAFPGEVVRSRATYDVKATCIRMHPLQQIERSRGIEIDQHAGDLVAKRPRAGLQRVADVVVEHDRRAGPQLRPVLQREVEASLGTRQHQVDAVKRVLRAQQGNELGLGGLRITKDVERFAVEVELPRRKAHQRLAQRPIHDRRRRQQEVGVVENHDAPGCFGRERRLGPQRRRVQQDRQRERDRRQQ